MSVSCCLGPDISSVSSRGVLSAVSQVLMWQGMRGARPQACFYTLRIADRSITQPHKHLRRRPPKKRGERGERGKYPRLGLSKKGVRRYPPRGRSKPWRGNHLTEEGHAAYGTYASIATRPSRERSFNNSRSEAGKASIKHVAPPIDLSQEVPPANGVFATFGQLSGMRTIDLNCTAPLPLSVVRTITVCSWF